MAVDLAGLHAPALMVVRHGVPEARQQCADSRPPHQKPAAMDEWTRGGLAGPLSFPNRPTVHIVLRPVAVMGLAD